jgi:NAD(P)-dependent dehydrogenase (short-subunit alcohol dehydrogenase family)
MSIAVVTGGAGGIGTAIGHALGAAGHIVAVVDIDGERADAVAGILNSKGITAFALQADITEMSSVELMATAVNARGDVGVVVNNAGQSMAASFEVADAEDWRRSLSLNLDGAYHVTRAFLAGLKARRKGVIVNVASVNGLGAFGNPAYSVAKAGLIHFTRQLAVEYGPLGIRAVSVVPGSVRTPAWDRRIAENPGVFDQIARFYPLRRVAEPEDVAAAVAFVASEAARSITGSEILVDCGLMAGNSLLSDIITSSD